MREHAFIARTLLLLGSVLTGASCEALFGGLSQANPQSCVANPERCQGPDSVCNQATKECEPALQMESITPRAAPYDTEVMVTIKGQNFVPGMTLTIGGQPATQLRFISNTELTAVAPVLRGTKERQAVELASPTGQTLAAGKRFHYFPFPQFAPAIQISSPSTFKMLRAADFNQDGRTDLALAADATAPVVIFFGQANGTLVRGPTVAFAARPFAMALGDANGDGKTDIAIAETGPQPVIEVALGKGDGTFVLASPLQVPITVGALALLDVSDDNRADLVIGNGANVSVYPSLGNGMFGAPQNTPHALQMLDLSSEFSVGDMNGDGRSDIILASGKDTRLSVFLNRGNGVLDSPLYSVTFKALISSAAVDLNQDGVLDVFSSVSSAQELQLFWGNGTGNMTVGSRIPNFATNECCMPADVNGDGTIDIVSIDAGNEAERFDVQAGDGGGVFVRSAAYPLEPLALARALYVGDLTADGKPDVVIAQRTGKLSLYQNVTP